MRPDVVNTGPYISVIIPVYNEEDNLVFLTEELVDVLGKLEMTWEVVFVDDGSTDTSPEKLSEMEALLQTIKDQGHSRL